MSTARSSPAGRSTTGASTSSKGTSGPGSPGSARRSTSSCSTSTTGPAALAHPANDGLYGEVGLALCHGALADGGVVAVWSAQPDDRFLKRLGMAGFEAAAVPTAARGEEGGPRHVVFVGVKRDLDAPSHGRGRSGRR